MNREARRGSSLADSADSVGFLEIGDSSDSLISIDSIDMAKWPWSPDRSNPSQNPNRGPMDEPSSNPMTSPAEQETNIGVLDPDLIEEPLEPGDHERYSHYVLKEKIVESAVTGKSVRALCGKKWIPGRDPMKFPICPICKEIHEGIRKRDEGSSAGGSSGPNGSSGSGGSDA